MEIRQANESGLAEWTTYLLKGTFNGKTRVDTIIGSDLTSHRLPEAVRSSYWTQKRIPAAVNNFLLKELEQNLNSVFSVWNRGFLSVMRETSPNCWKVYTILSARESCRPEPFCLTLPKIRKVLFKQHWLRKFTFYNPKANWNMHWRPAKKYLLSTCGLRVRTCIEQHKEITARLDVLKQNNIEVISISIDQNQSSGPNL